MVRFKNRHLLVEFLDPAHLSAFPTVPPSLQPPALDEDGNDDNGDDGGDGEDELAQIPDLPFMLPLDVAAKPLLGDGGASEVFKSVRSCVQAVFGDEGWGRVASSFKGEFCGRAAEQILSSSIRSGESTALQQLTISLSQSSTTRRSRPSRSSVLPGHTTASSGQPSPSAPTSTACPCSPASSP